MTEYEVYSYEAYRKKYREDIRTVENTSTEQLDQLQLEQYLLKRKASRPNLSAIPLGQLYELTGITKGTRLTLSAILLFSPYPQAYFPQLSILAARVPGTEMGVTGPGGERFLDSRRIEGTLPEMLEGALAFLRNNMRTTVQIDQSTGKRTDRPEYPLDALREAVLNALVHRDYSVHTENMPIQLTMYSDRVEIRNPGGLYGRMTVDQLGKAQPDTRNPMLVTAMEALGQTENRYSGIPRIRHAMAEAGLPDAVFTDSRGEFGVCLYNREAERRSEAPREPQARLDDRGLLAFCETPRTRQEIADFLGIKMVQYAIRRYVEPLVREGSLQLLVPDHPRSRKQTYWTDCGAGGWKGVSER